MRGFPYRVLCPSNRLMRHLNRFAFMKNEKKKDKKIKKKKKKNALVFGHDGDGFWTTQDQFWQWVRDCTVVKIGDNPLKGKFVYENAEYAVVISNTILNIKHSNHLQEALAARRKALM